MANCCTLNNSRGDICPSIMDIAKRLIIVPEVDNSGAQNKFATASLVTKSALQAKFNNADKDSRFFPLSIIENVEDIRAEPTFYEFNSGRKSKIKDGTRTFTSFIPFQGSEYLGKLEEWSCSKFGVYVIDKSGNFVYATDSATKLEVLPIMVDQESFSAELVKKTDGEPIMIKISFDFRESEKDSLLRSIPKADLDFDGLSSNDVYGLYDVKIASVAGASGISTVTITEEIYGFAIEGITASEITLSAGTITSFDEGAEGVYTLVTTATTGDTIVVNKNGYDSTATALVVG